MKTEEQTTTYYGAVVIFESINSAVDDPTLYEEEVVLIAAGSEEEAREKVIAYGKASEHSYKNCYNETITNSFKLLLDVRELIDEIEDLEKGKSVAVYGRYFRDYAAYEAFEPLLKGQQL